MAWQAGELYGFGKVTRDITERKRVEEALADYTRRLQSLSGRLLEAQETERRRIAFQRGVCDGNTLAA